MNRLSLYPTILFALTSLGVNALTLDKTEVSNLEYKKFLDANVGAEVPRYFDEYRTEFFKNSEAAKISNFDKNTFNKPDHPVVGVSWYAAVAYCQWRGGKLPTRTEWINLSGASNSTWSWGDKWDYSKANTGGEFKGENDGYIYSSPVVSFENGKSPNGQLNLSGNVSEWTFDQLVVGGSSKSNPTGVAMKSFESYEPEFRNFDLGFRCAQ